MEFGDAPADGFPSIAFHQPKEHALVRPPHLEVQRLARNHGRGGAFLAMNREPVASDVG